MKQWKTQHQMSNSQYDQYCRADSFFKNSRMKHCCKQDHRSSSLSANSQYDWWMQLNTSLSPCHPYHLVSTCLPFGDQMVIPLKSLWSHPMSRFEILVIFVRKLRKSSYLSCFSCYPSAGPRWPTTLRVYINQFPPPTN